MQVLYVLSQFKQSIKFHTTPNYVPNFITHRGEKRLPGFLWPTITLIDQNHHQRALDCGCGNKGRQTVIVRSPTPCPTICSILVPPTLPSFFLYFGAHSYDTLLNRVPASVLFLMKQSAREPIDPLAFGLTDSYSDFIGLMVLCLGLCE